MGRKANREMTVDEIQKHVWKSIAGTIEQFRERPDYFFTESDIHSYLYHRLYSSRMEYRRSKTSNPVYLVHREYPTNYRYTRASLLLPEFQPVPLGVKQGDRGNYDLVVLHPSFVQSYRVEDVINKDNAAAVERVRATRGQHATCEPELLFSIEVKFVIRNTQQFVAEVAQDNVKLKWAVAQEWRQARHAVNLVFCNLSHRATVVKQVQSRVVAADPGILSVFVQSHRDSGPGRAVANRKEPSLKKVDIVSCGT